MFVVTGVKLALQPNLLLGSLVLNPSSGKVSTVSHVERNETHEVLHFGSADCLTVSLTGDPRDGATEVSVLSL